jgi:hypothetical protein
VCVDCTFHANWSGHGGAICSIQASDSRMIGCRFLGNAGRNEGGAIFDAGRSLTMTNCVFSGNLASMDGGAAALDQSLAATFTNCTFSRNVAEGAQAGQALAVRDAQATVTNCILWDHVDATQVQITVAKTTAGGAKLTLSYSDLLGGESGILRKGVVNVTWGKGNIGTDPRFKSPAGADQVGGTLDDDLHLQPGSPCVDAGDNTAVPPDAYDLNANGNRLERVPFDLDGRARFVDRSDAANSGVPDAPLYPGIVDLGVYELTP